MPSNADKSTFLNHNYKDCCFTVRIIRSSWIILLTKKLSFPRSDTGIPDQGGTLWKNWFFLFYQHFCSHLFRAWTWAPAPEKTALCVLPCREAVAPHTLTAKTTPANSLCAFIMTTLTKPRKELWGGNRVWRPGAGKIHCHSGSLERSWKYPWRQRKHRDYRKSRWNHRLQYYNDSWGANRVLFKVYDSYGLFQHKETL